tara:strand:+ start:512 stop:745 length:234 start_codon:yes stop_codon:yes gene_type:complete
MIKAPLHRLPLDDWFDDIPHPHDSMPVATDKSSERPDLGEDKTEYEEEITIHEKMYQIATAKYNPFAVGGSESIRDK